MTKYSEKDIKDSYSKYLEEAKNKLKELEIVKSFPNINIRGFNGWIFERVVMYYLAKELEGLEMTNPREFITEQYPLEYELEGKKRKSKIDLKIRDKILVEIKVFGYDYGTDSRTKAKDLKKASDEKGFVYLYVTLKEQDQKKETSNNYRGETVKLYGEKNCFFLDKEDNWQKFVDRIFDILENKEKQSER